MSLGFYIRKFSQDRGRGLVYYLLSTIPTSVALSYFEGSPRIYAQGGGQIFLGATFFDLESGGEQLFFDGLSGRTGIFLRHAFFFF